ncbi:hypothetical protein RRG08_062601 [Elysia crispata]|uniref:Uncharacterized protein n=1 Tax=Elysia crispata TaxID=231223 RepID=A0AAE0YY73_9GAST|nr:hypothetical protein RRG08_062601 [Elysia crispata]
MGVRSSWMVLATDVTDDLTEHCGIVLEISRLHCMEYITYRRLLIACLAEQLLSCHQSIDSHRGQQQLFLQWSVMQKVE